MSKFINHYRQNSISPERLLDLNTLIDVILVVLLIEEDPMLSPTVKALQNKLETINSKMLFNIFFSQIHESDGLLIMNGKLVIPFSL